jgi:hypothetical protein
LGIHGYDDIDTDDQVTIRSEIARLTRLYDKVIRSNTMNSPDTYQNDQFSQQAKGASLRSRPTGLSLLGPYAQPATNILKAVSNDPDRSPATAQQMMVKIDPSHYHGNDNDNPKIDNEHNSNRPKVPASDSSDPSPITDLDKAEREHHSHHKGKFKDANQTTRGLPQGWTSSDDAQTPDEQSQDPQQSQGSQGWNLKGHAHSAVNNLMGKISN